MDFHMVSLADLMLAPAAFATVLTRLSHPSLGVYLVNLAVFTYIFLVTDRRGFRWTILTVLR
jgi:hypothetical protein